MKGLILKDILTLNKYVKTFLTVWIFLAILAITTNNYAIISGFIMIGTILVLSSFSYDDFSKWDNYALTLPITRKKIVQSKYIYMISLMAISMVLTIAILIPAEIIHPTKGMTEIFGSILGAALIAIIFGSILLPSVYKWGTEKARIMIFAIIVIIVLVAFGIGMLWEFLQLPTITENVLSIILWIAPIILTGILYISYRMSYHIYRKKDI